MTVHTDPKQIQTELHVTVRFLLITIPYMYMSDFIAFLDTQVSLAPTHVSWLVSK